MKHEKIQVLEGERGTIRIDDEVIASIAALTASSVEGVAQMVGGMADGITEMLGKKATTKGVKVELNDNKYNLWLVVSVYYGYRIPDVCYTIQHKVAKALEDMIGTHTPNIHITVHHIVFPEAI